MTTYTDLSSVVNDGVMQSSMQGVLIGSMSVMPMADESNLDCIILYTGETAGSFTKNRFYKCTLDGGVYSWVQTEVSESSDMSNYVQKTTEINGHPLSSDINLDNTDVDALADDVTINGKLVSSNPVLNNADVGALANDVTINGKLVSSNPALNATDVQAIPSSEKSTLKPSSTSTDNQIPTSKAVYDYVKPVSDAISAETGERISRDQNLQQQINAIQSKSDVVDVVGTKALLNSYDTTKLSNNDIVKVLDDESRNNETTYYRWVITGGVGAWSYVGSEGAHYTKAEADAEFVPQGVKIAGVTLTDTDISLDAGDVGAVPDSMVSTAKPVSTSTDATIPTSKAVYDAVNEKQDILVSGSNIKTINGVSVVGSGNVAVQPVLESGVSIKTLNNESLLGSGNITIQGGGTVQVDNALSTSSTNPVQNKVITNALNNKQDTLYSGSTIKTINNNTLLGSGNISIPVISVDSSINSSSSNPVRNSTIYSALQNKQNTLTTAQLNAVNSGITNSKRVQYDGYATGKQDALVSGSNIKSLTVNGSVKSLMGSGTIEITSAGDVTYYRIKGTPGGNIFGSSSHAVTIYFPTGKYANPPMVLFSEMRKQTALPNHHVYIYEVTTDHVTFRAGGSEFDGLAVAVIGLPTFTDISARTSGTRPYWNTDKNE